MAGEDIVVLESGDAEERVRRELDQPLGSERQRRFRRFLLAALGSVPWVGGVIAATAALEGEHEQQKVNELQQEWLDEHREKLTELGRTLVEIAAHGTDDQRAWLRKFVLRCSDSPDLAELRQDHR